MICPKCSKENRDDAIYCRYCGNKLDGNENAKEKTAPVLEETSAETNVNIEESSTTHKWKCKYCGEITSTSPCEHCRDIPAENEEIEEANETDELEEIEEANETDELNENVSFFNKNKPYIAIGMLIFIIIICIVVGLSAGNKSNNSESTTSEAVTSYPEPSEEYKPNNNYETDSDNSSSSSYPTKEEFINIIEAIYGKVFTSCYLSSPKEIERSFEISVYSSENNKICTIEALVDKNGVNEGRVTGLLCIASDYISNLSYSTQESVGVVSLSVLPATMALSGRSYFTQSEIADFVNQYFKSTSKYESGFVVYEKMYAEYQTKFMINTSYKMIAVAGDGTKLLEAAGIDNTSIDSTTTQKTPEANSQTARDYLPSYLKVKDIVMQYLKKHGYNFDGWIESSDSEYVYYTHKNTEPISTIIVKEDSIRIHIYDGDIELHVGIGNSNNHRVLWIQDKSLDAFELFDLLLEDCPDDLKCSGKELKEKYKPFDDQVKIKKGGLYYCVSGYYYSSTDHTTHISINWE